jgi:hypothetical protein
MNSHPGEVVSRNCLEVCFTNKFIFPAVLFSCKYKVIFQNNKLIYNEFK